MNPIFEIKYLIRRFTLQSISEQFSVRNRGKRDLENWGEGMAGKAMMMMMTMMMVMMTMRRRIMVMMNMSICHGERGT